MIRPFLLASACLLAAPANAATIVACAADSSTRACTFRGDGAIQSAVDRARDGDTVQVRAGRYSARAYRDLPYKEIILRAFVAIENKRLTLQGEEGVVLDGTVGLPTTAIGLKNADVTIRDLDIAGFRWDVREDDIYEGHGIFALDSRARIERVTIRGFQKMGLTGRGATFLDVTALRVLDGHVGSWLYEGAYIRLHDAIFRNNESSAVAVYNDSVAHLSNVAVDRSVDDALYGEDSATIHVTKSIVIGSKPIALNATGQSRIVASDMALYGNAKDMSDAGVLVGTNVLRANPRIDASYRPLPGSPLIGKDIGPRTVR